MSPSTRMFLPDVELGKKDDDHRTRIGRMPTSRSTTLRLPRRRRILGAIIGLLLVYLLLRKAPSDYPVLEDAAPAPAKHASQASRPTESTARSRRSKGAPPPDEQQLQSKYYYNGPLKFYSLGKTLYSARGMVGYRSENKIVLFAAANFKSLTDLLPLACEMAAEKVNRVHIGLMGRDEASVEGIQRVNNWNESKCPVIWHDARPDYGPWSTDSRMESSVRSGLAHIYNIFRPRIIITQGDGREEPYFLAAVKSRASQMDATHIPLSNRASAFKWIGKLDAEALKAWDKIQVEILVQAPPASSGSLRRLLKSLQRADYFGPPPALTIELPHAVDPTLLDYLSHFQWPPYTEKRQFTIRHRISPRKMSLEEATVRAIDAFYPRDPEFSHVLVLSSQIDLSPSFYHFLKFSLLKYKYSTWDGADAHDLLGLSLELPTSRPTDAQAFSPPKMRSYPLSKNADTIPIFLWQVPNSNAALYFGDKWVEFRSFLANRFSVTPQGKQESSSELLSHKFPAWAEYMLEFIRVRGYYLLFPAFPAKSGLSLATLHNELSHLPEEHISNQNVPQSEANDDTDMRNQKPLSGSQDEKLNSPETILSDSWSISPVLESFPGALPPLSSLDILNYTGEPGTPDELTERTDRFVASFKKGIGRCKDGSRKDPAEILPMSTDDLFCLEESEEGGEAGS